MLLIVLLAKLFVIVARTQDFGHYSGNFDRESGDYGFQLSNSLSEFDGECGGNFTASRNPQNLSTPLYPGNYPNDLVCVWNIRTLSENERIYLMVDDFETEEPYDFIKVCTAFIL